jgi:hypothetical protein
MIEASSMYHSGWARKWTLFGGLSTLTLIRTALRETVIFCALRKPARSSKTDDDA